MREGRSDFEFLPEMHRHRFMAMHAPIIEEGKPPEKSVLLAKSSGVVIEKIGPGKGESKAPKKKWPNGAYGFSRIVLLGGMGLAAIGAAFIGGAAFVWAIISFSLKVWGMLHNSALVTHNELLLALINCVEVFLAAPLPFLVVVALFHYINDSQNDGARRRLHDTKLLVFSLLLSLVTVELVSALISLAEKEFLLRMVGLVVCIICLSVYLYMMSGKKPPIELSDKSNQGN